MQRKLLASVNTFIRYGTDLTNPDKLIRSGGVARYIGLSLTVFVFLLCMTCHVGLILCRWYDVRKLQVPWCDLIPPGLGPIEVNRTEIGLEELDANAFSDVFWGGQYSPHDCNALNKVAIIVPYKNNRQQLPIFLQHMHQFLMKQKLDYQIFIVEQEGHEYYNRGKLLNVGFKMSQQLRAGRWQCFVFHDIDLLPLDTRNMYSCPDPMHPRHLAAAVERYNFKLPYNTNFEGVSAMSLEQFIEVDGYSNAYWGSNGESDDMVLRMHDAGYTISRANESIARYASLYHKAPPTNKNVKFNWYDIVMKVKALLPREGLSTLKYSLRRVTPHRLYTHIIVHLGHSPSYPLLSRILRNYKLKLKSKSGHRKQDLDRIKNDIVAIL